MINATVNLIGPRRDPSHEPSEAFLFSRRFCGSTRVEFESTENFAGSGIMTLADAMAISGAAVSPMAVLNNPVLFYALLLTNARLGQWIPNPGHRGVLNQHPTFIRSIASYLLSIPQEAAYLYVSDGGHHDNTGVEPLLQRRCRVIVACDASCDPEYHFLDLLRLVRRMTLFEGIQFAAADGGPMPLDTVAPAGHDKLADDHMVLLRLHYPEDPPEKFAWLIYMKSSLTGDEAPELLRFRDEDAHFPHDPTSDLFYEPRRFECYRELGYHLGTQLVERLAPKPAQRSTTWLSRMDLARSSWAVPRPTPITKADSQVRALLLMLEGAGPKISKEVIQKWHAIADEAQRPPKPPATKKRRAKKRPLLSKKRNRAR